MRRRRFLACSVALIFLAAAFGGCAKSSPPDKSLAIEEYVRLGMPSPDAPWSADNMAQAVKVLASLAEKGYGQLPRYQSERSGAVFARLTSAQDLEPLRDRSLPLEARMPQGLAYGQASSRIFMLYGSAFMKKDVRDSEVVELMGAQLRSAVVMIELVDELLPTIKKDAPDYQYRMQGLEKMKGGLGFVVKGALITLTERQHYRRAELVRLIGHMREPLPLIVPRLLPEARDEVMAQLEKMQDDPALKDLQPGLGELRTRVKDALEKGDVR
jgi:hypothetical protein